MYQNQSASTSGIRLEKQNYVPLSKSGLSSLLNGIREEPSFPKKIHERILQAIPGMTSPMPSTGIVAQKANEISEIYSEIQSLKTWNVDQRNRILEIIARPAEVPSTV